MLGKICIGFFSILLILTTFSCTGASPEGSVLHYSNQWGENPSGQPTKYRQLHIEAVVQNVGGDGVLWVNVEIIEKELLMEGSGVQSKKVYMKQGEQKTYKFDFWVDATGKSSYQVWCSNKPIE
jgi:hypothetical protein